ncbi:MAG: COG1361 S-layer family protein [Halobacteriales archaeon]
MSRLTVLSVLILVVVASSGLAAASPRGSPELATYAPDNRVTPGDETRLGVVILNSGDIDVGGSPDQERRITTARNVRLTMKRGTAPIKVESGTQPVGNVPEGRVGPFYFDISISDDADPGRYEVPIEVEYEYTNAIVESDPGNPVHQQTERERTLTVELVIQEDAQFEIVDIQTDPLVGSSTTVTFDIRNTGSMTARDATLTVNSRSRRVSFGRGANTSTFMGNWEPGATRTIAVDTQVNEIANGRPSPVAIQVNYKDREGDPRRSDSLNFGIDPGQRTDRLAVERTDANIGVGDTGTVQLDVTNTGQEILRDARVTIQSTDPKLTFGGSTSATTLAGTWEPGETKSLSFKASTAPGSDAREYPVGLSAEYKDENGEIKRTGQVIAGIEPRPEQTFEITNVRSTLTVGQEGRVTAEVQNNGDVTVRNAVVIFDSGNPNINPIETEYAVGTLEPGETQEFSFEIEISDSADAGPRQLSFTMRYRNQEDDVRRSDPIDAQVNVNGKRDVFEVTPVETSLKAGDSGMLRLRVTNTNNQTLRDISAKLFADDPISTDDDEAFIDQLEPGESAVIVFGVSAAGSAMDKRYPVSIDFQYDDADGDTLLSDTYQVPIDVERSSDGGAPVVPLVIVIVLALILGGGFLYYRRRSGGELPLNGT